LHDLQPVAVGEAGVGPVRPRDNVAVEFYRHAIALHAKLLDQGSQSERSVEAALVPVDHQFHLMWIVAAIAVAVQGWWWPAGPFGFAQGRPSPAEGRGVSG
jgi:hypothetical protein